MNLKKIGEMILRVFISAVGAGVIVGVALTFAVFWGSSADFLFSIAVVPVPEFIIILTGFVLGMGALGIGIHAGYRVMITLYKIYLPKMLIRKAKK